MEATTPRLGHRSSVGLRYSTYPAGSDWEVVGSIPEEKFRGAAVTVEDSIFKFGGQASQSSVPRRRGKVAAGSRRCSVRRRRFASTGPKRRVPRVLVTTIRGVAATFSLSNPRRRRDSLSLSLQPAASPRLSFFLQACGAGVAFCFPVTDHVWRLDVEDWEKEPSPSGKKSKKSSGLSKTSEIVVAIAACVAGILLFVLLFICCKSKCCRKSEHTAPTWQDPPAGMELGKTPRASDPPPGHWRP